MQVQSTGDVQKVHNQPFLISVVCEVYQPEGTTSPKDVYRGFAFKVMAMQQGSALMNVMGQFNGDSWIVARQLETQSNVQFEHFERKIKDILTSEPICSKASMVLFYEIYTQNISHEYLMAKGLTANNVPWAQMAKFYNEGRPVSRKQLWNEYNINPYGNSDIYEDSQKDVNDISHDNRIKGFTEAEMREAERSADILSKIVSGARGAP